jgi:hypothetical protein
MPKKVHKQKQKGDGTPPSKKATQKQALAEALRLLGPSASHAALARLVKERFGMELTLCILFPKTDTIRKPKFPSPRHQREPSPQSKCA